MASYVTTYSPALHLFGTNSGVPYTPGAGLWIQDAICVGLSPTTEVKVVAINIPGTGVYQLLRPNSPLKCTQGLGTAPIFGTYAPEGMTDGNLIVQYGTEEDDILSYYAPNATVADLTWDDLAHAIDDSVYRYIGIPEFLAGIGDLNYHLIIEETGGVNAAEWEIYGVQLEAITGPVIQSETQLINSTIALDGGCAAATHIAEVGRLDYYPVYKIVFNGTGAAGQSSGHIRIGA